MEIFYNSAAEPDRELLKLPIRGYVQAKSASRRKWRKWIEAAALEWEKIQGGIPLHETYILDTQKKTDPRNTDRFPLSHGKLSGFRVIWISKKPRPRSGLTNLHGSRCSPRASSGGTTRSAARPGLLLRRRGPRARDQAHPPPPDR